MPVKVVPGRPGIAHRPEHTEYEFVNDPFDLEDARKTEAAYRAAGGFKTREYGWRPDADRIRAWSRAVLEDWKREVLAKAETYKRRGLPTPGSPECTEWKRVVLAARNLEISPPYGGLPAGPECSREWYAWEFLNRLHSIEAMQTQGDIGTALDEALRLGILLEEGRVVHRYEPSLLPVIRARERAAESRRHRAADRLRREHAEAAAVWSEDPEMSRAKVATEVHVKLQRRGLKPRSVDRIARGLPARDALLPCCSKTGNRRQAHDFDKDGACLYCPATDR
jgi:hypothetical protein